jgi:hypothetical protein
VREILVKAGVRTPIVARRFSSIPATISFEASPVDGDDRADGTVEVVGSNWVFPKPPVSADLARHNTVHKGFWDTFYRVYVTADRDVRVTVEGSGQSPLPWMLGGLVLAAAVAVLVFSLVR